MGNDILKEELRAAKEEIERLKSSPAIKNKPEQVENQVERKVVVHLKEDEDPTTAVMKSVPKSKHDKYPTWDTLSEFYKDQSKFGTILT